MTQTIAGTLLVLWAAWIYYCVFCWDAFKEDCNRGPAYWLAAFCISGLLASATFTILSLIIFLVSGVING